MGGDDFGYRAFRKSFLCLRLSLRAKSWSTVLVEAVLLSYEFCIDVRWDGDISDGPGVVVPPIKRYSPARFHLEHAISQR